MSLKKRTRLLLVLLAGNLWAAAVPFGSVQAAPAAQGGNLINSSGFEGAFGAAGTDTAWAPWHQEDHCKEAENFDYTCRPEWSAEVVSAPLIHGGSKSQHIGVLWTPWHGGVFQTVNAPAGSQVRLTAWGRARASQDQ